MVKVVIGMVDKIAPGYKTYSMMGIAMGMMVCQMLGYHEFGAEAWGMVGLSGAATWKMGQDRK